MIHLDTSVALAHILAEDRAPPESLWYETLVASRLPEVELWTRTHARGLGPSHGDLVPPILARALDPFPVPLRTLDALHLASVEFLRGRGQTVEVASYDGRLTEGARALGIPLFAV